MVKTISTLGSNIGDYFGAAIALGIIVMGTAIGIGFIGGKAMDAIARQPEMQGNIRNLMILSAALIEGVAFFAAVVCLLIVLTK